MCHDYQNALWRAFAKTLPEFEAQFASEEACRAYLAECRWNGSPRCKRCTSAKVWRERGGSLYECGACGHQTSLTSGTLFHGTRKPLKLWFRAIWEVAVRRNEELAPHSLGGFSTKGKQLRLRTQIHDTTGDGGDGEAPFAQ